MPEFTQHTLDFSVVSADGQHVRVRKRWVCEYHGDPPIRRDGPPTYSDALGRIVEHLGGERFRIAGTEYTRASRAT